MWNSYHSGTTIITIITIRYKYRRQINPDGNFAAEHMKMKRPDLDVPLTDGEGYNVKDKPYEAHLQASPKVKEVCASCGAG